MIGDKLMKAWHVSIKISRNVICKGCAMVIAMHFFKLYILAGIS